MVCGGFTCSKNALAALNVLYMLVAFILIGIGAYSKAAAYITSLTIMGGIITCGVLLLFLSIVGLVGAVKHHQVMLFFYMIVLFLLFLVQFSVACACLAINSVQQKSIAQTAWNSSSEAVHIDVQQHFDCCGFEDQSNVTNCAKAQCCAAYTTTELCCGAPEGNNSTDPGHCSCRNCWHVIEKHIDQGIKVSGGIGLFFSFTEIMGVWLTIRFRNQKDPRANPSAFL